MKKLNLLLALVFMCAICVGPSQAAIKKVAQTGLQFLKVDVGARAAAMGGAYSLVGTDANAMFYNPAGTAFMQDNFDVFASHTTWIADISYQAVGLLINLGNSGNLGVHYTRGDYGDLVGTRISANDAGYIETGAIDVGAYAAGITYARTLTNKFTVGGGIKYAAQHLGDNLLADGKTVDNKVSGFAFDLGTVFYPGFKSFRLGMSVRNFSQQFKYEDSPFQLPLTFTIGVAMDALDLIGEHGSPLLISIDAVHPRDYTERIHVGGEYLLMDTFALRAGYKFNYDEESLSLGFGVQFMNIKFDYAYSSFGVFEPVSRISVGAAF